MDKVIYLDPDEEITSVLDKIKSAKESGLILVVPKGATLLQSLVNLKLLSKRALDLKKEIALVTSDKIGRNLASLVGFSVYSDIKDKAKIKPKEPHLGATPSVVIKTYVPTQDRLEEPPPSKKEDEISKPEHSLSAKETIIVEAPHSKEAKSSKPPSFPKFPKPKLPSIPFGFWIGLLLGFIVVVGVVYFLWPKATANLELKTEDFNQSTDFTVDNKATTSDFAAKVIQGTLKELEKEGSKKFPATGKKNIGTKASGTISISNSMKNPDGSGAPLSLKANIEVKDKKSNKIYLTNSAVNIPALTYSCDPAVGTCSPKPGTATVKITAKEGGGSYNIGPSEFIFLGLGGAAVSATSSENIGGGSDNLVGVVSSSDIEKAKNETTTEVAGQAQDEMKKKLEKNQKLLDGAVKEEIISFSSSVEADKQANDFEMKVKVKISTLVVSEQEYLNLLTEILTKILPFDKRLVGSLAETTVLSLISYDNKSQIMKVKAETKAKVTFKINEDQLKKDLAKKSKEEATNYLKSLPEVQNATVTLWPSWFKNLPQAEKIKLKIKP